MGVAGRSRVPARVRPEPSVLSANVSAVPRLLPSILSLAAVAVLSGASVSSGTPLAAHAPRSCTVLAAPPSLGATLLRVHRQYMSHQPDVHHPRITGPVAGTLHLGRCGSERYAIASFDARYDGFSFGVEDQPERFTQLPRHPWRDIGNTGGDPCGSAPPRCSSSWKIIRSCP